MSPLEWIGLGSFNSLWFSALVSKVPIFLAFEAHDCRQVLVTLKVFTGMTTIPIVMSIGVIGPESTIGVVAMRVMIVAPAEVTSRLV